MTTTSGALAFLGEIAVEGRVAERRFEVVRDGEAIPGILWTPAAATRALPLVLLGHGGSGHKRSDRMLELGIRFARDRGFAAAAIDGPGHGDRGGLTSTDDPAYRAIWQRPDNVPGMVADWQATLDALSELDVIDGARVGYWGMSMGTMFGLPLVAAEPRIRVAVLGKAGLTGSSVDRSKIAPHLRAAAPPRHLPHVLPRAVGRRAVRPLRLALPLRPDRGRREGAAHLPRPARGHDAASPRGLSRLPRPPRRRLSGPAEHRSRANPRQPPGSRCRSAAGSPFPSLAVAEEGDDLQASAEALEVPPQRGQADVLAAFEL